MTIASIHSQPKWRCARGHLTAGVVGLRLTAGPENAAAAKAVGLPDSLEVCLICWMESLLPFKATKVEDE